LDTPSYKAMETILIIGLKYFSVQYEPLPVVEGRSGKAYLCKLNWWKHGNQPFRVYGYKVFHNRTGTWRIK